MIVDTNALSAFAERNQNVPEAILSGAGPYLPVIRQIAGAVAVMR